MRLFDTSFSHSGCVVIEGISAWYGFKNTAKSGKIRIRESVSCQSHKTRMQNYSKYGNVTGRVTVTLYNMPINREMLPSVHI